MARTLDTLLKQREELERLIDAQRIKEKAGVIARILPAIAQYGLTAEDLFGATMDATITTTESKPARMKMNGHAKVYRSAHGMTWDGTGKRPDWLKKATYMLGVTDDHFLVRENGETAFELNPTKQARKKKRTLMKGRVKAIKYSDGSNHWAGSGPMPRWLRAVHDAGEDIEKFRVTK